jgi:hypothetical protein
MLLDDSWLQNYKQLKHSCWQADTSAKGGQVTCPVLNGKGMIMTLEG